MKLWMFGKGWMTVVGYLIMAASMALQALGWGSPDLTRTIHELGLVVGGLGVTRKVVAGQ